MQMTIHTFVHFVSISHENGCKQSCEESHAGGLVLGVPSPRPTAHAQAIHQDKILVLQFLDLVSKHLNNSVQC